MKWKFIAAAAMVWGAAVGSVAWAHHSYQAFDTGKEVALSGTIKEVQWTNPHIWLQVMIVQQPGKPAEEYGFEGGNPTQYGRSGWRKMHFKAGDKVTVLHNPMRDGSHGGNLIQVKFANGAILGRGGSRPDGAPVAVAASAAPPPRP